MSTVSNAKRWPCTTIMWLIGNVSDEGSNININIDTIINTIMTLSWHHHHRHRHHHRRHRRRRHHHRRRSLVPRNHLHHHVIMMTSTSHHHNIVVSSSSCRGHALMESSCSLSSSSALSWFVLSLSNFEDEAPPCAYSSWLFRTCSGPPAVFGLEACVNAVFYM